MLYPLYLISNPETMIKMLSTGTRSISSNMEKKAVFGTHVDIAYASLLNHPESEAFLPPHVILQQTRDEKREDFRINKRGFHVAPYADPVGRSAADHYQKISGRYKTDKQNQKSP